MLTEQHLKVLEKAIELVKTLSYEELIEYQDISNDNNDYDYEVIFLCFLIVSIYKKEFNIEAESDHFDNDGDDLYLDFYLEEFEYQYSEIWKPLKEHLLESAKLYKASETSGSWWWDEVIKRSTNREKGFSFKEMQKVIFYELKVPTLKDAYLKLKQKLYDRK